MNNVPIRLFFLVFAIITLGEVNASERDKYNQELENSRQKLNELDQSLQTDKSKTLEISAQIVSHDKQLERLDSKISALQRQITSNSKNLRSLEADLVIQRRNTQEEKNRLAEQLRAAYRMGTQSSVQLLLSHNDPVTLSRLSVYTDYYSKARKEKITSAIYSVRKLTESHLKVARVRKSLRSNKLKLKKTIDTQVAARKSREGLLANLKSGMVIKSQQLHQLQGNIEKLQALVEGLDKKESARNSAFSGHHGKLPWPVNGYIKARFGEPKSGGKLQWNGIYFNATEGEDILAIAEGEIVYADWLNGFGMLLIINHGSGYMSLYGGNRDLLADVGETVKKGQIVATVGDTAGQTDSGLYFEIRENAIPVDPGQWINPQMQFAKTGILEAH